MNRPDRRHWPTRLTTLEKLPQVCPQDYAHLTDGQRISLVFQATRACLAMQGVDWDAQRLQRNVVHITRREG